MTRRAGHSPISIGVPTSISIKRIQTSQLYKRACPAVENEELINSIGRQGLLQPIIVRPATLVTVARIILSLQAIEGLMLVGHWAGRRFLLG